MPEPPQAENIEETEDASEDQSDLMKENINSNPPINRTYPIKEKVKKRILKK